MIRSAVAGAFFWGAVPRLRRIPRIVAFYPLVIRGDGMAGELVGIADGGDAAPKGGRPRASFDIVRVIESLSSDRILC
jgi:hypothetical protein